MINNIRFDLAHIDLINTKIAYPSIDWLKANCYTSFELGEEAKTYVADGRILFACGMKYINEGVGSCWVVPSIYVDNYAKSFFKEMKECLDIYSKKMGLHRIQTCIDEKSVKWIEMLGFKRESVLEKINIDKTDQYLYVKFY